MFRGNGGGSVRRAADGGKGARIGSKEERPPLGQPCSRFLSVAQTPRANSRVPSAVQYLWRPFGGRAGFFGGGRAEEGGGRTECDNSTKELVIHACDYNFSDRPAVGRRLYTPTLLCRGHVGVPPALRPLDVV